MIKIILSAILLSISYSLTAFVGTSNEGTYVVYPPTYNKTGWVTATPTSTVIKSNQKVLTGPTAVTDIQVVTVSPGVTEIWTVGYNSSIRRYSHDASMTLLGADPLYGTPNNTNNRYQSAYAFAVNYTNNEIAICLHSRHVCRVYDLSTIANGTGTPGAPGTGGHKYDIGVPNGTTWRAAHSTTFTGDLGHLYNPTGVDVNPSNGNWIVANYLGFASASQTSSQGFISEYNSSGAFSRYVTQYDGVNAAANVNTNNRRFFGKIKVDPTGTRLYAIGRYSGGKLQHYDLVTPSNPATYYTNSPTSSTGITVDYHGLAFDLDGNILTTVITGNKRGVVKENLSHQFVFQYGNLYTVIGASYTPGAFNSPRAVAAVGDLGLGVGNWYVVADYSSSRVYLFATPSVGDGVTYPLNEPYYPLPSTLNKPIYGTWAIDSYLPIGSTYNGTSIYANAYYLNTLTNLKILLEKP